MMNSFWLTMPARFESIQKVSELLANSAHCIDSKKKISFYLGIHDLLNTAVKYGNLGLDWYERQGALSGEYVRNTVHDLRFTDSDYKPKQIRIRFYSSPEYAECLIFDGKSSQSFDWQEEVRCTFWEVDKEAIRQRGILTWLLGFDELDYSPDGRAVRARQHSGN